jgi:hypothetical protein
VLVFVQQGGQYKPIDDAHLPSLLLLKLQKNGGSMNDSNLIYMVNVILMVGISCAVAFAIYLRRMNKKLHAEVMELRHQDAEQCLIDESRESSADQ